jgi:O-succinylbenzoate synthase
VEVDAIEIYYVKHPLIAPWKTAYGEDANIHSLLVRMHSGRHSGWSESCPLRAPTYSAEFAAGAYLLVKEFFAPLLVGKEIESARQLLEALKEFKGNPFAKAAVEIAWWTLKAEMEQKPLHALLGGTRTEVEVGATFSLIHSLDSLLSTIEDAIDQGYRRVKLKVTPGRDIGVLNVVRGHFPRLRLHIDCNAAYTLEDAPLFREIDKLGLEMIEQPLRADSLRDSLLLQSQIETPICLDEGCYSVAAAREAIEIGACRYMNIKAGRTGGIQNCIDVHDLCRDAGIPCWVGGMMESAIGSGICVELATLENMVYPNDIPLSDKFYLEEISERRAGLSGPGVMQASKVPGLGYEPIMARVRDRTIMSATVAR